MAYNKNRAWVKATKRGPKMVHGLVPSSWVIRLANETTTRRIYEDWTKYSKLKRKELIYLNGKQKVPVSEKQIKEWLQNEKKAQAERDKFFEESSIYTKVDKLMAMRNGT